MHNSSLTPAGGEISSSLCVEVHVPSSVTPVQIELSTVAITSSSRLLQHLLVVVGEVTGRHDPPLAPEELRVVFLEKRSSKPRLLHSGCDVEDVFSAYRVQASIRNC